MGWFTYYFGVLGTSRPDTVEVTATISAVASIVATGGRGGAAVVSAVADIVATHSGAHQNDVTISAAATITAITGGSLLLETGDFLLLETGDEILLEAA